MADDDGSDAEEGGATVGGAGGDDPATIATTGSGEATSGSGGAAPPECGDGALDAGESCDDGNEQDGDGCSGCQVDPGWTCAGAPSACTPIGPTVVTLTAVNKLVPDGGYDGSMALTSMACQDVVVTTPFKDTRLVQVKIGAYNTWVGDLVIKLVSPQQSVLTLMSRPGYPEPGDDGWGVGGHASDLVPSHPIVFHDDAANDAEELGKNLGLYEAVCRDDAKCEFRPSPGKGPGSSLAQFNGFDPNGTWRLCVGDAVPGPFGQPTLNTLELRVLAW